MNNSILKKTNHSKSWHSEVLFALTDNGIDSVYEERDGFYFINTNGLVLHLINLNTLSSSGMFVKLQQNHSLENLKLIHLWEDIWLTKKEQVLARLKSIIGLNTRIHGRKTKIEKLTKPIAELFLNTNHLQGYVSSRYKLGLFLEDELVAVATFSALRKMKHSENYKSAELIRFAVKAGFSVTGGLSKLISSFHHIYKPNDIMTYADRDWSAGEAYIKLGFELTDCLAPQFFNLNENANRQLKKVVEQLKGIEVFNTGSLKYILKF